MNIYRNLLAGNGSSSGWYSEFNPSTHLTKFYDGAGHRMVRVPMTGGGVATVISVLIGHKYRTQFIQLEDGTLLNP